jgi:methyltransferase-like protein/cyclopropane fatty-acyl-phospholipid synthase-like methyltransferase
MSTAPITINPYDEMPFPSQPLPQSHPDRLAAVARLFGMQPAPVDGCRVLELGCATGGNLIPMADRLPGSQFVGVDNSRAQLQIAERTASLLQLKNLEFKYADIAELGNSLGQFDYIICHGVFSWVSDELQDKILELIRESLAPQGVAYISYNTHPGWYLRLVIREMLCSYAPLETTATARMAKGKSLLQFFERAAERESHTFAKMLKTDCEQLSKQPDGYIYHEYFESDNRPQFFHEFVSHAQKFALQYLGESVVATMFTTSFGAEVENHLQGLAFDLIAGEQHLDIIRNRSFRQSLICHWGVPLVRHLTAERLEGLRFLGRVVPVNPIADLTSRNPEGFQASNGLSFTTAAPILKAAMKALHDRWPKNYSFDELYDAAIKILGVTENPSVLSPHARGGLGQNLVQCLANGMIEINSLPDSFTTTISDRPLASPLARYDAQLGSQVTNRRHELVELDEVTRVVLSYLDGHHDRESLVRELMEAAQRGDVSILIGGIPTTRAEDMLPILRAKLVQSLNTLVTNALLIA